MLTFLSHPSCRAPIVSIYQSVLEFDMTKAESNRCKLHLKHSEEDDTKNTGSSCESNAAVAAGLSALDGMFTLKKEQRAALKVCLSGKGVFTLLFGKTS